MAPRFPVSVPKFTCKTTCLGLVLFVLELATTTTLFVLYRLASVRRGTYLLGALLCVGSIGSGVMGLCRSTPAVIGSLIVSIAVTFGSALLGGLCIIYALDTRSAVAEELNKSLTAMGQSRNDKLIHDTKLFLSIAAGTLLTSMLFHAVFSNHLYNLVGPRRGTIAYLQTFSLIVFPFSLFLIIGGQYVVDSATLASAPYTGIVLFGCGTLMLTVALLAFIGASFEYRRLLSMCVLLSYATGTCFLGLSIAYFALRKQVQENILQHWEIIQVILPPTFQARYDRDQFVQLISTNLKIVAFSGIICGLFIFQEATMCMTLMHHATNVKRQLAHDKQSMRQLQAENNDSEVSVIKPADPQVLQRHEWNQHFEASKRRQRIAMRFCVFLFVMAVAFILAIMCTNVVFAAKCHSIGKLVQATNFSLLENENASSISSIVVTNTFTRGIVQVAQGSDMTGAIALEQYGNAERSKNDASSFDRSLKNGALHIITQPFAVKQFLWIDGSCQRAVTTVSLPADRNRRLNVTSGTSVDLSALPVSALAVSTTQGNINVSSVAVLGERTGDDLTLTASAGEIELRDFVVDTSKYLGIASPSRVYAELGAVKVENGTLLECDADFGTGAGTLEVTAVVGTSTVGRSRVGIKSASGAIYASNVRANWLQIGNEDGDIFGVGLQTEGTNAFMGRLEVTNVGGDVTLQQIAARGGVHIETSSGNIRLQLATTTFTGLYFLRSDYGNVTIRTGFMGMDLISTLPDTATGRGGTELRGGINCNARNGSCLSYGDLQLRSRLGNIEVILGCDTYQCD